MDALIKITENNGQQIVSARELYDFLGYDKSQWSRWYSSNIVNETFFTENVDYQTLDIVSNGNPTKDFALTLNTAKELSMLARTEKGKQARQYFIECEKKALNPYVNLSKLDALKLAIESEEKALKYKALAEKNQTRADYLNHIIASDEIMDMGQVAKVLAIPKVGRNTLFKELRGRGYFFKNRNEPKQQYINQGLFQLKEEFKKLPNGKEKLFMKVLVTQKGLAFIAKWFNAIPSSNKQMSIQ